MLTAAPIAHLTAGAQTWAYVVAVERDRDQPTASTPDRGFDCMEVGAAGVVPLFLAPTETHFCGDRVMTERDRALLSRMGYLSQKLDCLMK
jgi:hypothetical protein